MSASYFMLRILRKKRENEKKSLPFASSVQAVSQCRICLKDDGIIPIYNSQLPFDVQDAIKTIGGIKITNEDLYPKHLCETCKSLLIGAVSFRKSAKESDRILRLNWSARPNVQSEGENDFSNSSTRSPENTLKREASNLELNSLHKYSIHKTSKRYKGIIRVQCPICFRLLTSRLYKKHVLRHRSASHLICDVCGKLYRKSNLERHLRLHSYDLPFQCQECPYRGRFMESLKIHMRTHSKEKPFSCDNCELQFTTRSNLNRHLLTHKKEKPHKCIECGKGFYNKRDLDIHFMADHSGIKNFGCSMCGNKYSTRKALMRHELRVHKRVKMAKGRIPLYLQAEYINSDHIDNR